jgi:hypothetical protein
MGSGKNDGTLFRNTMDAYIEKASHDGAQNKDNDIRPYHD